MCPNVRRWTGFSGFPESAFRSALAEEFAAVFGGADSADLAEYARKVLLCLESAAEGHVQDPGFGGAQDLLRALDPMTEHELVWAVACRLAGTICESARRSSSRIPPCPRA